eukprot:XP_001707616.1 Hypothetical protein GL50803_25226 [Giardia lamblia ATCC 50803]
MLSKDLHSDCRANHLYILVRNLLHIRPQRWKHQDQKIENAPNKAFRHQIAAFATYNRKPNVPVHGRSC